MGRKWVVLLGVIVLGWFLWHRWAVSPEEGSGVSEGLNRPADGSTSRQGDAQIVGGMIRLAWTVAPPTNDVEKTIKKSFDLGYYPNDIYSFVRDKPDLQKKVQALIPNVHGEILWAYVMPTPVRIVRLTSVSGIESLFREPERREIPKENRLRRAQLGLGASAPPLRFEASPVWDRILVSWRHWRFRDRALAEPPPRFRESGILVSAPGPNAYVITGLVRGDEYQVRVEECIPAEKGEYACRQKFLVIRDAH